jgi:ribonuclease HI
MSSDVLASKHFLRSTHVLWCDGSSLDLAPGYEFGAGAVIWNEFSAQLKVAYRHWEPQTQVGPIDCELLAATVALEQVPLECLKVILVADSQEVIDACKVLSLRRASLENPHPFNPRLYLALHTLLTEVPGREFLFLKVKGHALSPGNVLADKLATIARKSKTSQAKLRTRSKPIDQEAKAYLKGEVPVLSGKPVQVAGALVPAVNRKGTLKTSSLTPALKAQIKEQGHIHLVASELATIEAQAHALMEKAEAMPGRTKNQIAAREKARHTAKTYATRAKREVLVAKKLKAAIKGAR